MTKNIIVNLQVEGTHSWKDCNIEEVAFLKNEHRHLFHITCKAKVEHNDRAIEIISFKQEILQYLARCYEYGFGQMSCEDIAEDLLKFFSLSYCRVLEDGENGAEIWQ